MAHNKHHRTFKQLASNPDFFKQLCKIYLPQKIQRRIDWQSIKLIQLSGETTDKYREQRADILYRFNYDHHQPGLFLIHIEHQSREEKLFALRLLNYASATLSQYAKAHKTNHLPAMIQMVYYHGRKSPYPDSLNIYDLFIDKELATRYFMKPQLINLGQVPDKAIATHGLPAPAEYIFKYVYRQNVNTRHIKQLIALMRDTFQGEDLPDIALTMLEYGINTWNYDEERFMAELINNLPQYQGKLETMGDRIRAKAWAKGVEHGWQQGTQEGVKDGMEKGIKLLAIRMLKQGAGIEEVAKASGISAENLQMLLQQEAA